jgi:hypothetical protein
MFKKVSLILFLVLLCLAGACSDGKRRFLGEVKTWQKAREKGVWSMDASHTIFVFENGDALLVRWLEKRGEEWTLEVKYRDFDTRSATTVNAGVDPPKALEYPRNKSKEVFFAELSSESEQWQVSIEKMIESVKVLQKEIDKGVSLPENLGQHRLLMQMDLYLQPEGMQACNKTRTTIIIPGYFPGIPFTSGNKEDAGWNSGSSQCGDPLRFVMSAGHPSLAHALQNWHPVVHVHWNTHEDYDGINLAAGTGTGGGKSGEHSRGIHGFFGMGICGPLPGQGIKASYKKKYGDMCALRVGFDALLRDFKYEQKCGKTVLNLPTEKVDIVSHSTGHYLAVPLINYYDSTGSGQMSFRNYLALSPNTRGSTMVGQWQGAQAFDCFEDLIRDNWQIKGDGVVWNNQFVDNLAKVALPPSVNLILMLASGDTRTGGRQIVSIFQASRLGVVSYSDYQAPRSAAEYHRQRRFLHWETVYNLFEDAGDRDPNPNNVIEWDNGDDGDLSKFCADTRMYTVYRGEQADSGSESKDHSDMDMRLKLWALSGRSNDHQDLGAPAAPKVESLKRKRRGINSLSWKASADDLDDSNVLQRERYYVLRKMLITAGDCSDQEEKWMQQAGLVAIRDGRRKAEYSSEDKIYYRVVSVSGCRISVVLNDEYNGSGCDASWPDRFLENKKVRIRMLKGQATGQYITVDDYTDRCTIGREDGVELTLGLGYQAGQIRKHDLFTLAGVTHVYEPVLLGVNRQALTNINNGNLGTMFTRFFSGAPVPFSSLGLFYSKRDKENRLEMPTDTVSPSTIRIE